ncbi:hypothetical protein R3P38DRAFT_3282404 [Favolaschia claudopus]|uniref:Cytochrome b5 heme-binding domain-containing protein n=1 Tax=Favolaschia claudopus TaxID=2862362 RepID=A0AAW0ABL1_9AGAR
MSNSWSNEKKRPLILPPANKDLNANLEQAASELPCLTASELEGWSKETEYEYGARIFVGLKDYVFDVTSVPELHPTGGFGSYAFKDISYALVKGSILEEDTLVSGYSSHSQQEVKELREWLSAFLLRFPVVAKLIQA